ncbi:MerR family transcriptional regulator [Ferruginibacter yonginensis]|uniref:MerR family transcriptional regulator n=1 Tax=Ferruginibacter yonginensis TaxID=1310416 RepID=A0ABV8QW29_9BACT
MPLKQTSLFDFGAAPETPSVPDNTATPNNEMVVHEPTPNLTAPNEVAADLNVTIAHEPTPFITFDTEIVASAIEHENITTKSNNVGVRGRKKLSEQVVMNDVITVPDDDVLFQKKYYAIGIVADMFKVNISLIRFWEKEFDILKPKLNGKGDRHFRPEDVKNLKLIYHLLRERKYTIEGAKAFLKKNKKPDNIFEVIEDLKKTKQFLIELKLSL